MKKLLTVLAVAVVVASSLGIATSASANWIYSYTGNNFNQIENDYMLPVPGTYTTAMSVTGSFEVASPIAGNASDLFIAPLSYSFFDGRNTYNNINSVPYYSGNSFKVWTNGSGEIINWYIILKDNDFNIGTVQTAKYASGVYDQGSVEPTHGGTTQRDSAIVWGNPGVWTATDPPAPVPEPGTMMLLGSGLVGLVGYGRRRFKK